MKSLLCALLPFFSTYILAQSDLPVLRTTVDKIDIREGENLSPAAWSLAFELKPDVYAANVPGERVTFYSDLDSISWIVTKEEVFDFVIVRGSDTAWTRIQYEASKLEILRGAAAFDYREQMDIPTFTYQPASDEQLYILRAHYKLDSIAGNGDELSKIKNLMHWVHDLIPHDGQHPNPEVKNAVSLIAECKKEQRGLNCRGLATVLNECYLAMGIPSRFVTCMPKDSVFDDCHVINMVYSRQLSKWVWMDPTNDAWVMDENGNLLSIEEVRTRLIEGKPLVLNEDANWNHQEAVTKEHYLDYYMAKNLYRFSCPLHSAYDYETRRKKKEVYYLELIPLDGLCQTPKYDKHKSRGTKMIWHTWKTNNPALFWRVPGE